MFSIGFNMLIKPTKANKEAQSINLAAHLQQMWMRFTGEMRFDGDLGETKWNLNNTKWTIVFR